MFNNNWVNSATKTVLAACLFVLAACGGAARDDNPDTGTTNHAPTMGGDPSSQITAGATYAFIPTASDEDGDLLTFTITNKPTWASFNTGNGALSGSPSLSDLGTTTNIVVAATDGKATTQLPPFSIAVSSGSALLKWSAPSARVDSTPLMLGEIGGYRIYHGTTSTHLEFKAEIADPSIDEYSMAPLTAGTHYFSVTAYDNNGSESELSNVVAKLIN